MLATLPKDLEIGSMEVTIITTPSSKSKLDQHQPHIFDQGRTKFSLVLIGGVLIEMGHPFVMIVATKVIANRIFKDLQNRVRPHSEPEEPNHLLLKSPSSLSPSYLIQKSQTNLATIIKS